MYRLRIQYHKHLRREWVSGMATKRTYSSHKGEEVVKIGDVQKTLRKPKHPTYVPCNYTLSDSPSQSTLRHLQWMLKKDVLGQDMFLIGRPGPMRRSLAMQYLQLTNQEVEYVSLTRDTTESDLKQRREMQGGTASYIDQSAVRAATEGRVLVIEGIEKAERNVLPVLNNLLENREMQLEDGRFLMASHRYDQLVKEGHSPSDLAAWNLVRVSKDFKVIALGLPVPKYAGNPLDPPLRSRFQARDITLPPFKEMLQSLLSTCPEVSSDKVTQLLSCAYSLMAPEVSALTLPDFPLDNLHKLAALWNTCPWIPAWNIFYRLYPYKSFLPIEGQKVVEEALISFDVMKKGMVGMEDLTVAHSGGQTVELVKNDRTVYTLPHSVVSSSGGSENSTWVPSPSLSSLLAQVLQSHLVGDFCIIGSRGCGKSSLLRQMAAILGCTLEPIMLYQDMTSRDLLQQRTTLPNGDTVWRYSPLVMAALEGKIAVLDGIQHLHSSTMAAVQRLVHDRELQLYDGTRLIQHDRYDLLKSQNNLTNCDMSAEGVLRVHPSFRIVGLAEPPSLTGMGKGKWLNAEQLSLFLFHTFQPLTATEEMDVIESKSGSGVRSCLEPVVNLSHRLRSSPDLTLQSLSSSLSLRQHLRMARKVLHYPTHHPFDMVHTACLSRFLPPLSRKALEQAIHEAGIMKPETSKVQDAQVNVSEGVLTIGQTSCPLYQSQGLDQSKVPKVLFYDIGEHVRVLESLLQDFIIGEHLLLIGNQGVGKNKLVDRLLELLHRPREYIQLHRDTTVQSLTLQPTVKDGVIIYEDSPLVQAARSGRVLVVDEADKAPTHVTRILKSLVESGEMLLSDGRRIVPPTYQQKSDLFIPLHEDFRMIVLANRPGFPFLGNDFFAALGDLFSCHAIENPSLSSELSLLESYGPDVHKDTLTRLVKALGELRKLSDEGQLPYPYSTREAVNIVKHLQHFPSESLVSTVSNVFDFDSYSEETREVVMKTLHKYGIPVGAKPTNIHLGKQIPLPKPVVVENWSSGGQGTKHNVIAEQRFLKAKGTTRLNVSSNPMTRIESRSLGFSEMHSSWSLPIDESCTMAAIAVDQSGDTMNDTIYGLSVPTMSLFFMTPTSDFIRHVNLESFFGFYRGMQRIRFTIAPLGMPGKVAIHEGASDRLVVVDTSSGEVSRIESSSSLLEARNIFKKPVSEGNHCCLTQLAKDNNILITYEPGRDAIDVLNLEHLTANMFHLPIKVQSVHLSSPGKWLIQEETSNNNYVLEVGDTANQLVLIGKKGSSSIITASSAEGMSDSVLSEALGKNLVSPNRLMTSNGTFACVSVGYPDLHQSEIYAWPREDREPVSSHLVAQVAEHDKSKQTIFLPEWGQVIRPLPASNVPKEALPKGSKLPESYLEVVDVNTHMRTYVPVPRAPFIPRHTGWLHSFSESGLLVSAGSNSTVVTTDGSGNLVLWETGSAALSSSLQQWKKLIGAADLDRELLLEKSSGGGDVTNPKHGKVDATGAPHVGGNTWAGGTGGRDTAGLGGKGGPYRLDAGHDVHQIPDVEKADIPQHVRDKAREMALKAFKQRLRDIEMSEYDAELYEQYATGVRKQVQAMRVMLSSLQARNKERQWLRHQTSGELDDTKLVEGLTGEKGIYKRRLEQEPEPGSPQEKPKRLKLLVDVSGSMYRFNGYDGRLDRIMEAALLVMEAFEGYENKFEYDIIGHSGESSMIQFVNKDKCPKNNKHRLDVIKTMHAHAQFCLSGDNTLESTILAINTLAEEDSDEAFVVVLSDANLERYGIPPQLFSAALTSNQRVNAFAIFIGSLGDQAQRLTASLPVGRGFVCLDLATLPQVMQQIFTSSLLSTLDN